jgi:hypothetical protein
MIMGLIKPAGKSGSDSRNLKLHGSASKRGMAKWGGRLQQLGEKPKGGKGK